ncbi:MAG: C-8 sterol isomerase [Cyphobasidiales sp. Tagirdzhanova-0007]|nr:MAG: C-8 sterol isomerase [Cyphobasidiales sp. Tagirdzhanova-0007]
MPAPPPKVIYRSRMLAPPPRSSFSIKRMLLSGALISFLVLAYSVLDSIKHRWYIFDLGRLQQLQSYALEKHPNNTRAVIDEIVGTLRKELPSHCISEKEEWVFNNAGGAMGGMYIIHASVTEYLIIFGSPIGTEGHTGRHTADDYFHILHGEQTAYAAGSLTKEVYPAGSVHHLERGTVKQYKFHEECWALEYARGPHTFNVLLRLRELTLVMYQAGSRQC